MALQSMALSTVQHTSGLASGKYLIFELGAEEFGISVMKVNEIMKMQEITRVPRTASFIEGVINLRGRIIPVANLRRKFGMLERDTTDHTCIVVVRLAIGHEEQAVGLIVDSVVEVLLLNADDIEDRPDFGAQPAPSYIQGITKHKEKVKILLDIDQVLSAHELESLHTA